jgi:glycerol 2-dehydrogenase (NADP+)
MPMVGLGTFLSKDPEELETVLKSAILEKGYRHIDCAQGYGNEDVLGRVLKYCFEQGIKREDLFIVTKCLPAKHDAVEKSLEESLEKLQLTYVDLYLVHHMCPKIDGETWEITGPSIEKVWK